MEDYHLHRNAEDILLSYWKEPVMIGFLCVCFVVFFYFIGIFLRKSKFVTAYAHHPYFCCNLVNSRFVHKQQCAIHPNWCNASRGDSVSSFPIALSCPSQSGLPFTCPLPHVSFCKWGPFTESIELTDCRGARIWGERGRFIFCGIGKLMQLTKTWDKQQQQGEEHKERVGEGKEGRICWSSTAGCQTILIVLICVMLYLYTTLL